MKRIDWFRVMLWAILIVWGIGSVLQLINGIIAFRAGTT